MSSPGDDVLLLAHASDLHVPAELPWHPLRWHPKRALVAAHHAVLRHGRHPVENARALAAELARELASRGVDHVALTGDLTVFSFDEEFSRARSELAPLLELGPASTSVIPGNHDRFTRGSARAFDRFFGEHALSDPELSPTTSYPFLRLRKGVAILGLDSGVPTPLGSGTGRLGRDQLAAFELLLASEPVRAARFRVVLVHHGPFTPQGRRDHRFRRLEDDRELLDACGRGRVDLVLHGHIHCAYAHEVERHGHRFLTVGAGSSTMAHDAPLCAASYHLYEIRGSRLARLERRLLSPATGRFEGRCALVAGPARG